MSDRTSDRRMKRLLSVICLLVAGVGGATIGTAHGALAATNGNSAAAHACQQAGYLTLIGTNGTTDTTATPFTNTGDCVSYAAHGGTLVSKTAAAPCLNNGYKTLTTAAGQPAFSSEAACVLFVGQGGTPVPVGCVVKSDKYPTIQSAVNDLSCTTIQLLAGTYQENVTIHRNVTIQGAGAGLTIVTHFTITGYTTTLSGLTIRDGSGVYGGGISISYAAVTVTNSIIFGNNATYGGGIYNYNGTLTVTNSTITNNGTYTGNFGGGIYNEGGTVTVTNSTITDNTVDGYGGGIYNYGGTVTVTKSTISNNGTNLISDSAGFLGGGGIYNSAGMVTVTDSTISGNYGSSGGGLYNRGGGILTVTNSTIMGNTATAYGGGTFGGGIYNEGATVTVTNSTITGNTPNNCTTDGAPIPGCS